MTVFNGNNRINLFYLIFHVTCVQGPGGGKVNCDGHLYKIIPHFYFYHVRVSICRCIGRLELSFFILQILHFRLKARIRKDDTTMK